MRLSVVEELYRFLQLKVELIKKIDFEFVEVSRYASLIGDNVMIKLYR